MYLLAHFLLENNLPQTMIDESFGKTLHQIRKSNIFSINSIQCSVEAIKKELTKSALDISHWGVSYNQENSFLIENLDQVTQFLINFA